MIRIDLDLYKRNKPFATEWFLKYGRDDIGYSVANLAVMTMCPCVVTAFWVAEATGWREDAVEHIRTIIKFYGYSDILNKPDGSPL
jgi:hypothetical protein